MTDETHILLPRSIVSELLSFAYAASAICGSTDSVADWIREDAKNAMEHDPSVGIFSNEEMARAFNALADLAETIGPNGPKLARIIYDAVRA